MVFKEFNSFYKMKEWLLKGEYTLPAIYHTVNDSKTYIDYAIEPDEVLSEKIESIKGFKTNSQGQLSKILCLITNNHFTKILPEKVTDGDGFEHDTTNKDVFGVDDAETGNTYSFNEYARFTHYGLIDGEKSANTIARDTFAKSNITEIIIPEGITHIQDRAFYNCKKLVRVVFPSTLLYIGESAFLGCESLEKIVLPPSLKLIDTSAFMSCKNLSSISLGNGVITIKQKAFCGTAIESITIPNSVYAVGSKAFAHCPNLKNVYIGKNLGNRSVEELVSEKNTAYKFILYGDHEIKQHNVLKDNTFYGSPIEKFKVHKLNQYVKTGSSGELMVSHHIRNSKWRVIKVPVTVGPEYTIDDEAVSIAKHLFDGSNNCENINVINFNNVKLIPSHCFSNNKNELEIVLPHVHKLNDRAFDNTKIKKIELGGDEFQQETVIDKVSTEGYQGTFRIGKDCQIIVPTSIKPAYHDHHLWGYYMPKNWKTFQLNNVTDISSNQPYLEPGKYEVFMVTTSTSTAALKLSVLQIQFTGYKTFGFYIYKFRNNPTDKIFCSFPNQSPNLSNDASNYQVVTNQNVGSTSNLANYTYVEYKNMGDILESINKIIIVYQCQTLDATTTNDVLFVVPKPQGTLVSI